MWNRQRLGQEIERLHQQQNLLMQKLERVENARILETHVDEKLRLEHLINETQAELDQIDKKLSSLQKSNAGIWKLAGIASLVALVVCGLVYWSYHAIENHLQNGKNFLDLREMALAREEYQQAHDKSWLPWSEIRLGLEKTHIFDLVDNQFNSQVVEQRIAAIQKRIPR